MSDTDQSTHEALKEGVVFHVHGVTKVYQMGEVQVHALRGVDLDLYRGEFSVLLGASGSGKSTFLVGWIRQPKAMCCMVSVT